MFRWFRNFGQLLKKPKGALQTEKSRRARSVDSVTSRSTAGRGGGHGGRSQSTGTSQSRSVSFAPSVRSRSASVVTGRTYKSRSNSSSAPQYSTRSSRSRTQKSTTNSSLVTGRSKFSSNASQKSQATSTRSTASTGRSRFSSTASQKSQATSTRSTASTGRSRFASTASASASRASTARSSQKSEASRNRSVSTGRSRLTSASTPSVSRRNMSTRSTGRSNRGRNRTRRDNVNADRSSISSKYILSPTNRTSRVDRSVSRDYERAFTEMQKNPNLVWNQIFPKGTVVAYTDGSYLPRSGKLGIGVFMGPNHELNRSHRIRTTNGDNNYAEFIAVRTALENLKSWKGYDNEKVIIRTDSMNVIDSLTGKKQMYPQLCDEIRELSLHFPKGVNFEHVYAHSNDPGNEMADILAGVATSKTQVNLRSRSASPGRRRSASRERNRKRSLSNDREFIRSHSAHLGPKV